MEQFRKIIYNQHDVECNQKYADVLPYSTHLNFVEQQANKFIHLIPDLSVMNKDNRFTSPESLRKIIIMATIAHDSIEDARLTYNDLVDICGEFLRNSNASKMVADIVYCVTDEKGKTRSERKSDKYYAELKGNQYAVFVKLADLAANTLFSKLSGSTMYNKYKKEFPKFKEKLFIEKYEDFFNYIEKL